MTVKYKATVFIPTWFGEQYMKEVLDAVMSQKLEEKYEVLIYDTSSKDRTVEIVRSYQQIHENIRFVSLNKSEFSHGKTRQRAAEDAKGEFVVYITQDATPAHDRWLYEILKPFELNDRVVAVMGKQDPRPHCFPLLKSEIRSVFRGFGPDFGTTLFYSDTFANDQGTYDAISFYSDVNSAARKDFLCNTIPYQDVPYSEDQLFGRDIINAGYLKSYAPRANVVHSNDMALNEYKSRMFDETIGLRKVGIPVDKPRLRTIVKISVKGILRDWINTLNDRDYSWKRKLYWLVLNPLYHIEKWRGVRLAATVDLKSDDVLNKYSLESRRNSKHVH